MRSQADEDYDPEMVAYLQHLDMLPPARVFDNFEDLMAWLESDD